MPVPFNIWPASECCVEVFVWWCCCCWCRCCCTTTKVYSVPQCLHHLVACFCGVIGCKTYTFSLTTSCCFSLCHVIYWCDIVLWYDAIPVRSFAFRSSISLSVCLFPFRFLFLSIPLKCERIFILARNPENRNGIFILMLCMCDHHGFLFNLFHFYSKYSKDWKYLVQNMCVPIHHTHHALHTHYTFDHGKQVTKQ